MKKILGKISWFILLLLTGFAIYVWITHKTFVYKALFYNFADIDDYSIFENRLVENHEEKQPWRISTQYNRKELDPDVLRQLKTSESVAFLVTKNDSIVSEMYWDGYNSKSYSNSFSMAKTVIALLVGIAIEEKKIESLESPVSTFLPFVSPRVRFKDLLTMSGGTNWVESYSNPLSTTTEAYYGTDLWKICNQLQYPESPGKTFSYRSIETQLLAFALMKATGKSISEYASEKIWTPLGMENKGLWSIDKENGAEKAYCCLNSNARDFSKLGQLIGHMGMYNGKQIVPLKFMEQATTPAEHLIDAETGEKVNFYGFQLWIIPEYKGLKVLYARGILGQYVISIPEKKIVIVRLGKKRGEKIGKHYREVFQYIDQALKL